MSKMKGSQMAGRLLGRVGTALGGAGAGYTYAATSAELQAAILLVVGVVVDLAFRHYRKG